MTRKKTRKRKIIPWNKGRTVGRREPLTRPQVTRIKKQLAKRGAAGLKDLALFLTAIDTMLEGPDLLGLRVKDVRKRNRVMRDTVQLEIARSGKIVQWTPSQATLRVLEQWIDHSAKKANNFLFTGQIGGELKPISARQYSRLVKDWVNSIGLDVSTYGTVSLRRTRAV
jgi:integrase